jgi:hypothetical protein
MGALKYAMRCLARQAVGLRAEIKDLDAIITTLVKRTAPQPLARHGVGPCGCPMTPAGTVDEGKRD